MASKHPIRGQDIVSGKIKAQDCTVNVGTGAHTQVHNQKPWADFRSFWEDINKRRQRIGVLFRRKPRRSPHIVLEDRDGPVITTPHPPRNNGPETLSQTNSMRVFGSTIVRTASTSAGPLAPNQHVKSNFKKEGRGMDGATPANALMIRRVKKKKSAANGKLSERDNELSNSGHELLVPNTNVGSNATSTQSGKSQRKSYSETEHSSPGYIPPETTIECTEFTSSAVMIKPPSGSFKAMKLFYDTMSTDNWASEDFVKKFGLQKRPILPDDLRTYETVKGTYTPRYYIEIVLQDESRGMKEFVTMSANVTPAMDGIGLVAGVGFMREHRITSRDVTAHRDIYVTTGRKADAAAREAQRQLLEKATADALWAKQLCASTAGPSTQPSVSGVSSQGRLPSASSQSSNSSSKSNVSKT